MLARTPMGGSNGGGRKGIGGSRDEEGRERGRVKKRGRERARDGGAEGGRVGGTERGKEGRRMGTRAKPGNQLVYHICIHLLNPHWTMPRQAVISTQQHKLAH